MKLDDLRREFCKAGLRRADLNENPTLQLENWLHDAASAGLQDNNAMTLATVAADGQPSQRVVLLKQLDEKGLVFFTNLRSEKAKEIACNNKVSVNFAWLPLERQVKIKGIASQISTTEAFRYFASRPKNSQIAAWVSNQSQAISSRQFLVNAFEQMKKKFAQGEIPLPDFWGGYCIQPTEFEFWQGGSSRLHDRFRYRLLEGGWKIDRLAP